VHVVPRARKNEVCGRQGEAIKIRLTAPPVEGAANKALIDFLAEVLGVSRQCIEIVSGVRSHHKIVCVLGLTPEEIEQRLGMA
jgi:uncharacterized protein (TIGR00251 family)